MTKIRLACAVAVLLVWGGLAAAGEMFSARKDLDTGKWDALRESVIRNAPYTFEQHLISLVAPTFGEDSSAVPISIETKRELGTVEEFVLMVDNNPFPVVMRARPAAYMKSLSLRIRMQESSPVRVAARTSDGVWHVADRYVKVSGGGCSVATSGPAGDQKMIGQVRITAWGRSDIARLRFQVMHPMDTGLAKDDKGAVIPPYYVFKVDVQSGEKKLLELESTPIARNPAFAVDMDIDPADLAALQVLATDSTQTIYISEAAQVFMEPGLLDMTPQMSRK